MFSHEVYLEGCTLELREICDYFVENAMQDDLGQKLKSEMLEEMLKIAHDFRKFRARHSIPKKKNQRAT